jgi:hopanoid biosynthesis associated protein HpnK
MIQHVFSMSAGVLNGERDLTTGKSGVGVSRGPRVIFNADDFGASSTINAAVIQAHREGVLTSTSLMVAGKAADEAVALARETPTLAVGLHLVVVNGPAVLPPSEIPHLVGQDGCFRGDPVRLGLRYAFSTTVRQEMFREMEAQFARFAATGLPLSHVDGHLHMQMHPAVLGRLIPLAARYGAKGLRFPRDELRLGLSYDHHHAGTKITWAIAFGLLTRQSVDRLAAYGLVATRRVYGLMQSGHMEEEYVLKVLRNLSVPTAELYFHPDTQAGSDGLGPNRGDLQALLSPAVARLIRARGLQPAAYADLATNGGV